MREYLSFMPEYIGRVLVRWATFAGVSLLIVIIVIDAFATDIPTAVEVAVSLGSLLIATYSVFREERRTRAEREGALSISARLREKANWELAARHLMYVQAYDVEYTVHATGSDVRTKDVYARVVGRLKKRSWWQIKPCIRERVLVPKMEQEFPNQTERRLELAGDPWHEDRASFVEWNSGDHVGIPYEGDAVIQPVVETIVPKGGVFVQDIADKPNS